MHILDIVQNSLRARAARVEVRVGEYVAEDRLIIEIGTTAGGFQRKWSRGLRILLSRPA